MKKLIYLSLLGLLLNSCEKDNNKNNDTNTKTKDTDTTYSSISMRIHRDLEDYDWPWDYVINKDGNEELIDVSESGNFLNTLTITYESNNFTKPKVMLSGSGSDTVFLIKYNNQNDIESIYLTEADDEERHFLFKKVSPTYTEMYVRRSEDGKDSNLLWGSVNFKNGGISSIDYIKVGGDPLHPSVIINGESGFKSTFSQSLFSIFTYSDLEFDDYNLMEQILISYYNKGGYFLMGKRSEDEIWTNIDPSDFDVTLNQSGYPTRIDWNGFKRFWTAIYQ